MGYPIAEKPHFRAKCSIIELKTHELNKPYKPYELQKL